VIVKAPVAHPLTQDQQFESVARVAAMGHHAVERGQMLQSLPPFAALAPDPHGGAATLGDDIGARQHLAGPQAFGLDLRVSRKFRSRRDRQAESIA